MAVVQLDRPLVLVVEDNEKSRLVRSERLKDIGFAVIPVEGVGDALTCLRDGPAVDLIVTDIHLGPGRERGGVDLARTVNAEYDSDLPVVAYSGRYFEEDLTTEELALFRVRKTRGSASRRQMDEFDAECFGLAEEHRKQRIARSEEAFGEAFAEGGTSTKDLILSDALDDLENVLRDLGYEMRLITSSHFSELATVVAVWVRHKDAQYEVQVCGQPFLHWQGDTEEVAISGLVAVMAGFADDFRRMEMNLRGPSLRLRSYLQNVIAGGAVPPADS